MTAIIGFIGGQAWNYFNGPEKVIVSNFGDRSKDTTISIVKIDGDTSLIKFLKNNDNLNLSISSTTDASSNILLNPAIPQLIFPKIVEGYTKASLNGYGLANVTRSTYSRNEVLKISLKLFNPETLDKISPIFMDIQRKISNNSYNLLWNQQFKAKGIDNIVQLSTNFEPGNYQLTIGFYLMDEVNQKFPPFYSQVFTITII